LRQVVFGRLQLGLGIDVCLDMITPLDQPMDPMDNMTPEEAKSLEDWEEHFKVCPFDR
jgi:hypothetical protein